MAKLQLFLFGMPRLVYEGQPVRISRRKGLALVAYLALAEGPESREALANLLWPDLDHPRGRSALRSTLRALTTATPEPWIEADRLSLTLNRERVWVDVDEFNGLLAQSETHGHSRKVVCPDCAALYQQASALYQADFLAGFTPSYSLEFDDWQRTQGQWLRWEYAELQRRLAHFYARSQEFDPAIKHAYQWLVVDPLHEPAHRLLMRLYTAQGQRAKALQQYEQLVDLLDRELATLPDEETRTLYEAIQGHQPQESFLDQAEKPGAATSILPPLPSLVIGRESALAEIKGRLGVGGAQRRATTVIQGWPGVGKSTTAAKLAHDTEVARQYPEGILWASLGETPNLFAEVSSWADILLPGESGRRRSLEEICAQLTAVLRDKRMLLIVDDVWQTEHARPFRVGGQECALVMTTRLNDVAIALAPTAGDIYRLPVLTGPAGLELLHKLSPETVDRHPREAQQLVRNLEGLPLAIHVAGRLLHSEARLGWGVRELLDELRNGAGLLKAQAPSDMLAAGHEASPTVAALLKRSTDMLDEPSCHRFAALGLFVPKPATFDLEAMAIAWDIEDPRPMARLLVSRGLLEPISGGRFQMHALLVWHARSLLDSEGQ